MNAPHTLPRHKLSIDDYHQMGRAGILSEDSRVELLEGELIDMAPIGSLRAGVLNRLSSILNRQTGDSAIVSIQNPVSLPPDNEPQPDIVVLKPRADWYYTALPGASDVLLIIEISDTTVERDRVFKSVLYARHGIAEFWLFDLQNSLVEVFQKPVVQGYRDITRKTRDDIVSPLFSLDVEIRLSEIFPVGQNP